MTVGTRCTLRMYRWAGPPPVEGDFLRTRAGSCYLIDEVRESRSAHIAHVLRVTRLGKDAVCFGQEGVSLLQWMRRPPAPARSGP